jgi:hypothetical protein
MLNPVVRMIRVSFQGFCEVQDENKFPVRPEDGGSPCWVRIRFYRVAIGGKSYPDDLPFRINLHLVYFPLDPTSNGEGVHPGQMLLNGTLSAFSHNQSGSA